MHKWSICPCDNSLTEALEIRVACLLVAFERMHSIQCGHDRLRSVFVRPALFVVFD